MKSKPIDQMRYLALLRGINVGGNKKVSMQELKDYFAIDGFTNITTILNTGNVVFDAQKGLKSIQKQVDELLEKNYDFSIPSVVYSEEELVNFMEHNGIQRVLESVDKGSKVIFTFARDLQSSEVQLLEQAKEFTMVHRNDSVLCIQFAVDEIGTPAIMKALDSALNKRGTSRNLNTVNKIIKKLEAV